MTEPDIARTPPLESAIEQLRCEFQRDPRGVDVARPRLSWRLGAGFPGARQVAYQVLVSRSPERFEGDALVWDSGRVASGRTAHVEYEGPALRSREVVHWTVRAWPEDGEPTPFAPAARWEAGLLAPEDWTAEWIALGPSPQGFDVPTGGIPDPARDLLPPPPLLRRAFTLDAAPRRARLYVTALGFYEAQLNGARVGDGHLTPGWTDYDVRVQYQVHDVTEQLHAGENALGVCLADGWYAGYVGWEARRRGFHWGTHPELLLQLEVETDDGLVRVVSDETWVGAVGPLRCADLLLGETWVASGEQEGWSAPGFDDGAWWPVAARPRDARALVGERTPPVRVLRELPAVAVHARPDGSAIVDFGQNLSGRVRLHPPAGASGTIVVRHGEELTADGDLYTENLRFAQQKDVYELDGEHAPAALEPRFTVHGFRYAHVSGWPGPLDRADATAISLCSLDEPTGAFACSDPLVTQLHENVAWTLRGNFLSVPTDSPQRDERMGWLGDAALFAETAGCLADVASFLGKWTVDIDDARTPEGLFPDMAPRVVWHGPGAPGWGDGGVIVPWALLRMHGDVRAVERLYEGVTRWIAAIDAANPDGLRRAGLNNGYGDWLVPPGRPRCSNVLFATALYAHCVALAAELATATGHDDDARRFEALHARVRTAFVAEFAPGGRIADPSETARVLALAFDLLDPEPAATALEELVADLEAHAWTPGTGLHGSALLCPALTRHGRADAAYRLVQSTAYPSWCYQVEQGATTVWERWDGRTPDGEIPAPVMCSFNQYALGSVAQWLYETVLGIDVSYAGERPRVRIAPQPGGTLTWARGGRDTLAGRVECEWRIEDGELAVEVELPPNVDAVVGLPGAGAVAVGPGRHALCAPVLQS